VDGPAQGEDDVLLQGLLGVCRRVTARWSERVGGDREGMAFATRSVVLYSCAMHMTGSIIIS
jgi:hypothetical protein